MASSTAIFTILISTKQATYLMQAADLFDEGKVIGFPQRLEAKFASPDVTIEEAGKLISILSESSATSPYDVWFCHLIGIDRPEMFEKNRSVLPYCNFAVRQVSNGEKYGLLRDYIDGFGLVVETTPDMYIKKISFS